MTELTPTAQDTREKQALQVYVKLMRACETVTAAAHRHLAQDNLTTSQFAVLELLYHKGSQHQSDIARKTLKSCGNITTVIDNLEKRGLVTRRRTLDDRRYITIELTSSGQELIARVFPRHAKEVLEQFKHLGAEDLEDFGRLCRQLGRKAPTGKDPIP